MSEWISVDERIPDKCAHNELSKSVLAYCSSNKCVYVAVFWRENSMWHHFDCGRPVQGITHWMPLPDGPKG